MRNDLNTDQMREVFEEVSHYFFLLSEPTRLKILYALCNGEQPVGAIVSGIGASQANVSRQLNMLFQARILQRRKEGLQVYYRIEDQHAIEVCRMVCNQMVERVRSAGHRMQPAAATFVAREE